QRADRGRGFAIVMPHFYKNWAQNDLRTLVLNGIVWSASAKLPAEGARSQPPDLASFGAKAVETTGKIRN
ncbi:MAG TPA: hypothetical protein DCE55_22000, partial [Planctomycetaceae bacterium]|nr:hypothetical protein [Planctomycetaceae bacterium]